VNSSISNFKVTNFSVSNVSVTNKLSVNNGITAGGGANQLVINADNLQPGTNVDSNIYFTNASAGSNVYLTLKGTTNSGLGAGDFSTYCVQNVSLCFATNSTIRQTIKGDGEVHFVGTNAVFRSNTLNNGLYVCNASTTNQNSILLSSYLSNAAYNPANQLNDNCIIYTNVSTNAGTGVLNIMPWHNVSSGLRMAGMNNTFTGSLTVAGGAFRSYSTYVGLDSTKLNYGIRFQTFNNTATSGTCYMDFFSVNNIYSSTNLYDARIQCTNGSANVGLLGSLDYLAANHNLYGVVTITENNGNPLILKSNGTTNNFWMFNTYPNTSYLGLRNASSGGWSSVLFAFDSRATKKCAGIDLDNSQFTGSLTNPRCYNGLEIGTGDGATMTTYNVAINSWYGIGFYNSWLKTCNIVFDTRSGTIISNYLAITDTSYNNVRMSISFTASSTGSSQDYLQISTGNGNSIYGCLLGGGLTQNVGGFFTLKTYDATVMTEVVRGYKNNVTISCSLIVSSGNVGIGTTTPGYKLEVSGAIYASGDITALSDRRYKDGILPITNALETVSRLQGCSYIRKDYKKIEEEKGTRHIGLIAQDVEAILPEVVTYDKVNDKYGINYGSMAGIFVEAIKELDNKYNSLINIIQEQQHEIQKLKNTIDQLTNTSMLYI
jgi:hypothetical protein